MKISLHRRVLVLVAAMTTALAGLAIPSATGVASAMAPDGVRLNEAQTSNSNTLTDQSGASPDWLELFNGSAAAVNIGGWTLTDDAGTPDQWAFPADTSIGPGATLLVFASGTGTNVGGELHTNFKLSSSGEYLGLYDAAGALVSSFDPIPAIPGDSSWGVNAAGVLNLFDTQTPDAPNGTGTLGILGDVTVSPDRGFYDAPVQVSLAAQANTTIRYTLDGSTPSATNGSVYNSPITVSSTTVLRTVAVRNGWSSPKPVTSTYLFVDDVPDQSRMNANIVGANRATVTAGLTSLPVISLTSANPDNSPRFTWDQDIEAQVAVEMIFPDGTAGFQVDAGATEVGGHSVRYDKDSLRLKFGSEFGESSLDYPLFDGADNPNSPATDSFKRLTLRMGAHDTLFYDTPTAPYRSYLRARWHDETMLDLGHTNTHGRYVNVFLNGQYWGQYHLREHFDDHFMASYEGGDNEDYVGINQGVIAAGSGTSWSEFSSARGKWEQFSQIVDPINYVDFMLISEYGGNTWDLNHFRNWRAAGPATNGPDTPGFIFMSSDPDISLISTDARTSFNGPLSSWSALLSEQHPDFVELVVARSKVLFEDGGVMSETAARDRWNRIAAQIDQSVHSEYARWSKLSPTAWESNNNWFRNTLFPVRADNVIADVQSRLSHLGEGGTASQSSTCCSGAAALAIDGNTDGDYSQGSVTATQSTSQPWWQVDLGSVTDIGSIRLWNRVDCCQGRLSDFHVFVSDVPFSSDTVAGTQAQAGVADLEFVGQAGRSEAFDVGRTGRYVRVQLAGTNTLSLAEVQIFGGAVSEAPTVTNPGAQSSVVGETASLTMSGNDPQGGAITWSASGLPAGLTIDPDSGEISGTVREAETAAVTVTATNPSGASGAVSFDWDSTFPSPSRMILNEWNAVDNDAVLKNGGSDSALGTVVGNGGDWFELVVIEDNLDIRGWTLEISDEDNVDGVTEVTDEFTFGNNALLGNLRAGTIITVSEDFADDPSYNPEAGDWTINLQANSADDGAFFTAGSQSNFGVNNQNWQLIIRDDAGNAVFGPAGEGAGASGVGSDEIGELEADPTGAITPASAYDDGDDSTFGEPNSFDGRLQDFSAIRPVFEGDVTEPDAVIDSPVLNEVLGTSVVVSGSASDDVGVAGVGVAIRNRDSGEWLRADGSFGAFQYVSAVVASPGAVSTGWSFSTVLPEGRWFVMSRAEDTSGNRDSTRPSTRFTTEAVGADVVDPDGIITEPTHRGTSTGPDLSVTGTASDNVGVARVRVSLQNLTTRQWLQADGTFGASYAALDADLDSVNGTQTGWSFDVANLSADEYAVSARAIDAAGNTDPTRPRHRFTHS